MDDVKVEKTPESTHTTINRTEEKPSGSGAMLWFLLGGVIVVIAVIAYFVFNDGMMISRSSEPTDGNVSINVETNEAPTSESESAPATEEAPAKAVPD